MVISITGITGNMGQAVLAAIEDLPQIDKIKLLCHSAKRMKKLLKAHKRMANKLQVIEGGMTPDAIAELIKDAALVINMAAVIPPRADHFPKATVACNQTGVFELVDAIERITDNQPALIHISTVAVYGNRSGGHPFGRVGDPLLSSPLDVYSATKIRSEFKVLESKIQKWAILRQSAMLHPQMLSGNISDPLMYHTTYDAPLEWTTAKDSGLLIRNIVKRFADDDMPEGFWKHCFDITGGKANRQYGYQTFEDGFKIIGGGVKDFFKPHYTVTRNFHGCWYLGNELQEMFDYHTQTTDDYWKEIAAAHPVFKLGKIVPKWLIRAAIFKPLLKNDNAPVYWVKHNNEAKVTAFFGSLENYEKLVNSKWSDITLPDPSIIPTLSDNAEPVFYGYDINKRDDEITNADAQSVAEAHGGKLLTPFDGDMYKPLEWETQDGEKFTASAYTVMRAGHWYNPLYNDFVWDFDRLSKRDKVFASVWYDSHDPSENNTYYYDSEFKAHLKKADE